MAKGMERDSHGSSSPPPSLAKAHTARPSSQYIVQRPYDQRSADEPTARVLGKRRHVDHIRSDAMGDGRKLRVLSSATRIYIIPDKIDAEERDAMRSLVTRLGGMNASLAFANVIVTALKSAKRVQRHLDGDAMERRVPVLHASWLHDSAQGEILQPYDEYQVYPLRSESHEAANGSDSILEPKMETVEGEQGASPDPASREGSVTDSDDDGDAGPSNDAQASNDVHGSAKETLASSELDVPYWQNSEYACLRPTPLRSRQNQDLVDALETLRLQRILGEKSQYHATAYGRAISAIKAYPHSLAPNPANAKNIKGVGPKIAKLVVQYYEQGSIAEVKTIRTDDAFRRMTSFMNLYGIGPKRARELYSEGARSLDDVVRMGSSIGTHLHVDECLRILPDLETKIPRSEVEEIAQFIQSILDSIKPGCIHTICGGYRRGKSMSNDVDIVITDASGTFQKGDKQIHLMGELLDRLKSKAFMTHVINVTTPSNSYERTFSHLDVAEIVVLPPKTDIVKQPRYRRVDLILGPQRTYGAAVLGWTGSRQFERDLRLIARHAGYTFHSTGLTPIGENKPLYTPREKDVFDKLQIPYMPPTLRNCDA